MNRNIMDQEHYFPAKAMTPETYTGRLATTKGSLGTRQPIEAHEKEEETVGGRGNHQ
ncbi:hypothetical protein MGYG_05992 [Nannizzia gypsea CBS 118893]|uniref:Uncharacterized protein n=1 Tax=Arthroderma gypseum (strain ATCC MYA-4604 / CBS 118893) TaxID=535722 RepID=E4V055_ARTGP|nr:hypothetical protein MGYG_05992 [Nannizzia gypsea CBS 118893]EFR02992.1 hypothetical protein MGYG_05992 [Nannizzia gypsea CBS 118893]